MLERACRKPRVKCAVWDRRLQISSSRARSLRDAHHRGNYAVAHQGLPCLNRTEASLDLRRYPWARKFRRNSTMTKQAREALRRLSFVVPVSAAIFCFILDANTQTGLLDTLFYVPAECLGQ